MQGTTVCKIYLDYLLICNNGKHMKSFFKSKIILLLFLMMMVEMLNAQTRSFTFNNSASKEGFSTTSRSASNIRMRHSLKKLTLNRIVDNGYSGEQIELSGIFLPADQGKPNLPTNSCFVAIPHGSTVNYNVNNSQVQIINNVDLMAASPIYADTDDTMATYEKDTSIYNVNAFYPENPVVVSEIMDLRGVQTVIVSVTPYQYNPVTKVLKVFHDIDLILSYENGDRYYADERLRSPYFDKVLQQSLVNYNQLPVVDYESRMRQWISGSNTGCEYLIVIPDDESFRPYAQQLANYRTKQGILTEVKSLNEMGCTNSSQIKDYIHNAYNNWDIPPVSVLLFGDYNTNVTLGIPAEVVAHPNGYCISDNGYADVNGDGLPDICFSRLVAANANEAEMMVNKTINYEYIQPNMDVNTYQKPTTALGWQTNRWFQICAEAIGGYWRNMGKTPIRINDTCSEESRSFNVWSTASNTQTVTNYFGPNGMGYIPSSPEQLGGWIGGTGQQIVDAVNNGTFIIQHRDHGYVRGWGKPVFNTNYVSQMNNTDKLTFVMSVNCQSGKFDYTEGNCLVESLMRRIHNGQGAGAVGCIAPTESSYSFVNDTYVWGIYDFFDSDFMPDYGGYANCDGNWMPAFGNVAGKYFLHGCSWPNNHIKKNITYKMFTAHCDAFLRLFTTVPQTMTVEHPSKISMGIGRIIVKAPEGAMIALTVGNKIIAVAEGTGNYQDIQFQPQLENCMIDLVVTKQDYLQYEAKISNLNEPLSGPSIIDSNVFCGDYVYMFDILSHEEYTYDWSCSSNLTITSTDNNKLYVRPNEIGDAYIQVEIGYQGVNLCSYIKDITILQQYNIISQEHVSSNTTWGADNYYILDDVYVEPNATLTVTGTVYCSNQAAIIVKPGAKLVINGGHLLCLCDDEQWNGIQVWGDSDKHQFKENGHYWQGVVELKNNAIIENAIIAIDVWNKDADDPYSTTGGIVLANDSKFINNARAVNFEPYENQYYHPSNPEELVVSDNASYFKNCIFEVDSDYVGPEEFFTHANLYEVRGVSFIACDFILDDNPYNNMYPVGIYAYNAGFSVNGSYNNIINIDGNPSVKKYSTFDNFYKAVVSTKDGSVGTRSFSVKATIFTNNQYGVYAFNSGFATILDSEFEVGQNNDCCSAGIYAENTPYFVIEQNDFTKSKTHPKEHYGIIIKNSKSINQIYKNIFVNLYCANMAIGINYKNNTFTSGLTYRCNENYNNNYDFYILGDPTASNRRNGIQQNQGMKYEASNNVFSQSTTNLRRYHIANYGDYNINYYYDNSQTNAKPIYTYNVALFNTNDTLGCPSHYALNNGVATDTMLPVLPKDEIMALEDKYHEAYGVYTTIKSAYDKKIDGGNTLAVIDDINTAQSDDVWTLRTQLLGHSPYLSEDVLKSVVDRDDIFVENVLFEILAANPEELKKNSLMSYLKNKENPLPEYMINILQQISEGVSSRSALESQMAKYNHIYTLAAGDIVRSMLNDTVVNTEELKWWLGNMNDINADRDIISIYLEENNYADAITLANMLPSLYDLTEEEIRDHDNYMSLLSLYNNLYQTGRTTFQLTDTEKIIVEDIANSNSGTASSMAQSIMESVYGITISTCPQIDSNVERGNKSSVFTVEDISKAKGLDFSISPNPANSWCSLDYTLPGDCMNATIIITDIFGVKVYENILSGNQGNKVIDLRDIASGIYTCTIRCKDCQVTNKLVIAQ